MESFCRTLPTGSSFAKVVSLASQNGYRVSHLSKEQRAFVHEPRSMGRFICSLQFREEHLVSAKYVLND